MVLRYQHNATHFINSVNAFYTQQNKPGIKALLFYSILGVFLIFASIWLKTKNHINYVTLIGGALIMSYMLLYWLGLILTKRKALRATLEISNNLTNSYIEYTFTPEKIHYNDSTCTLSYPWIQVKGFAVHNNSVYILLKQHAPNFFIIPMSNITLTEKKELLALLPTLTTQVKI